MTEQSYDYNSGRHEALYAIKHAIEQGSRVAANEATLTVLCERDDLSTNEFDEFMYGFIKALLDRIVAEVKNV